MEWQKESILVLVEAAPNWSQRHRSYLVCTAGVDEKKQWRRLYPMPLEAVSGKIHRWDMIEVEATEPERDPRSESRRINYESIVVRGRGISKREEQRAFLNSLSERSLDVPTSEKRSITLIKPSIVGFRIEERKSETVQLTLNGNVFNRQPYGDVGLYYEWRCPEPCEICSRRPHNMECFDWGANILWKRYEDDKETAKQKVTEMCYSKMKDKFDVWFALGTHSQYPFSKWMVVGILWMNKKGE